MVTAQVSAGAHGVARRTVTGAAWAMLAFVAARVLSYGSNLVLARLLAPTDFGLVSFAMIFIGASTLLQDLGVSAAIVHSGRDPRAVAGTALTINVVAALALFVVIALFTPVVAGMQADPATPMVLLALALGVIVTSIGSVQSALLMKQLAYRRKFLPDSIPYAVGGAVSVVMALTGFGVWSLVIGSLVRTVTSTILLWALVDVRPWPELRWPVAWELLGYGRHVAFQSILGFASNNVDYFIIGYAIGAHALGVYTMAYSLATLIPAVSNVAVSVMFPALSRLRNDRASLEALFADGHRVIWTLSLPLAILLFVGAPAFVQVVLGERWTESIVLLQILAAAAWLQSIAQIYSPVAKAIGRPDLLWKFSLLRSVVSVPLLLLSVRLGEKGVATCVVLLLAIFAPLTAIGICRSMGYPTRRVWSVVAPSLGAAAATCLLVGAVYATPMLRAASESLAGGIALASISLLIYLAVVSRLDRALPDLVWMHLRVRFRGAA